MFLLKTYKIGMEVYDFSIFNGCSELMHSPLTESIFHYHFLRGEKR